MVHFMFIASVNSYATNAFVDDVYITIFSPVNSCGFLVTMQKISIFFSVAFSKICI